MNDSFFGGGGPNPSGNSPQRYRGYRLFFRTVTAAFFIAGALVLQYRFQRLQDWPAATGYVTVARVVVSGDPNDSRVPGQRYEPLVQFTYTVDGDNYMAETLTVHRWIYRTRDRAERVLREAGVYPGARVPVFVNRDDPSEAYIIRDIPWRRLEVWLVLLFMVVLPVVVVLIELITFPWRRSSGGDTSFFRPSP